MLELLQKHAPMLCAASALWLTYGYVQAEPTAEAFFEETEERVLITPSWLELAEAEDTAPIYTDPFRNELIFPDAQDLAAASPFTIPSADDGADIDGAYILSTEPELPAGVPTVQVTLRSVLGISGGRGSASINGRTVYVGQELPDWPADGVPPVLAEIVGESAFLYHAGAVYELQTHGRSTLQLASLPGSNDEGSRPADFPEPADEAPADESSETDETS